MTKKILITSIIVVALFILVSLGFSRAKVSSVQPQNSSSQTTANPLPTEEMLDSQGGVDVSVDEIKRESGKTILTIGINNHVEDYSQIDLTKRAEWAGVKPSQYTVDQAASGGHHVSSQLIFPGNLSGLLTIKLTDELVFNINVK